MVASVTTHVSERHNKIKKLTEGQRNEEDSALGWKLFKSRVGAVGDHRAVVST